MIRGALKGAPGVREVRTPRDLALRARRIHALTGHSHRAGRGQMGPAPPGAGGR